MPNALVAHTGSGRPDHTLADHLGGVGRRARKIAEDAGFSGWLADLCETAGRWHDLGKARGEWQSYVGRGGGDPVSDAGKVPHAIQGAQWAEHVLRKHVPIFVEYAIAGHHAGLNDSDGLAKAMRRDFDAHVDELSSIDDPGVKRMADCAPPAFAKLVCAGMSGSAGEGMDLATAVRMLFSVLVDADRLDTAEWSGAPKRKKKPSLEELAPRLDRKMASFRPPDNETESARALRELRESVRDDCRRAADGDAGVYVLEAPTGSGKTLASMEFAFRHAARNGQRRIVYACLHTTPTAQNAEVLSEVFGSGNVLEHHSSMLDGQRTREWGLDAENWDRPLVVTTVVQLFESLFSPNPSRCRKLHAVANSVVVVDEAQTIPMDAWHPVCFLIDQLVRHYNCTVVLCTATQVPFGEIIEKAGTKVSCAALKEENLRRIVGDPEALFGGLSRTHVHVRVEGDAKENTVDVLRRTASDRQALMIVNTRRACVGSYKALRSAKDDVFCLSTWQTPVHRKEIVGDVEKRLKADEPVVLVSTSMVEAGWDVSFPKVYRALAPFPNIMQAEGRCNRENNAEKGEFVVFSGELGAGFDLEEERVSPEIDYTRFVLRKMAGRSFSPEDVAYYFRQLKNKVDAASIDGCGILGTGGYDYKDGRQGEAMVDWMTYGLPFRSASFRMIRDPQREILVFRDGKDDKGRNALDKFLSVSGSAGKWSEKRCSRRMLQDHVVKVYGDDDSGHYGALASAGALKESHDGLPVVLSSGFYDPESGVVDPRMS